MENGQMQSLTRHRCWRPLRPTGQQVFEEVQPAPHERGPNLQPQVWICVCCLHQPAQHPQCTAYAGRPSLSLRLQPAICIKDCQRAFAVAITTLLESNRGLHVCSLTGTELTHSTVGGSKPTNALRSGGGATLAELKPAAHRLLASSMKLGTTSTRSPEQQSSRKCPSTIRNMAAQSLAQDLASAGLALASLQKWRSDRPAMARSSWPPSAGSRTRAPASGGPVSLLVSCKKRSGTHHHGS